MTDLSMFDASGQSEPTSGFDASTLDKNLRTINAVERGWRLPSLPDAVKFDLASIPGVTSNSLASLLQGIDDDLNGSEVAEPKLYQAPALFDTKPVNPYDKARVIFAGVADQRAPTEVTGDAVKRWKMEAIDRGYLDAPEDGVIDSSWSPEFRTIKQQMAYDDLDKKYRGDDWGSISFRTALDQLGKWTSPTGLLQAATDLDLFWDFGAINKEISSWGDKWRKVGKSENPWDFAKNFVDALTGPIDDILVPIANWALLASGVSEAYNFARVAYGGQKAFAGAQAVEGLYQSSRLGRFLQGGYRGAAAVATDVERMSEASMLATRFSRSGMSAVSKAGDAMTAWREMKGVAVSKKMLQTGMRLGVVSQAEDLLPGYQGGKSLYTSTAVGDAVDWTKRNPLFAVGSSVGELFLTPYSVFKPGSFTNATKKTFSFAGKYLGTTAGRATVGAVGGAAVGELAGEDTGDVLEGMAWGAAGLAAAPAVGKGLAMAAAKAEGVPVVEKLMPSAVGHVGDFLQKTSWKPMTLGSEKLAAAFHSGILDFLADDASKLAKYESDFAESGFAKAFAGFLGVDEEAANAAFGYVSLNAALDHVARAQSGGARGMKAYHAARNKLTAQLRTFDLENLGAQTLDEIAWAASLQAGSPKAMYSKLRAAFEEDPTKALEYASQHNLLAQDTLRQLLSVESLPDLDPQFGVSLMGWTDLDAADRIGVVKAYLPQVMPTFGNWPAYTARMSEMRTAVIDDLFADATFLPYVRADGSMKAVRPVSNTVRVAEVPVGRTLTQEVSDDINQLAFFDDGTDVVKLASSEGVSILGRPIQAGDGRFTLGRAEHAFEGDIRAVADELKDLKRAHTTAMRHIDSLPKLIATNGDLTELSKSQLGQALMALKGESARKDMRHLVAFAKRRGVSLDDAIRQIDNLIDEAVSDPRITDWIGLDTIVRGKPNPGEDFGAVLRGRNALDERIKQLDNKAHYTAAKIDTEQLLAKYAEGSAEHTRLKALVDGMEQDGYVLVHGREFLAPEDIAFNTPVFTDITRRHLNAATLGNFFKGRLPAEARMAQERRMRAVLVDELGKVEHGLNVGVDSPDVDRIIEDVTTILRSEQALADQVRVDAAHAGFLQKRLAAIKTSTTPVSLADLGTSRGEKVIRALEGAYGRETAAAIAKALPRMRNTEFKDVGLYALEANLRSKNQLAGALKTLSGSKYGEGILQGTKGVAVRGALAGAAVGYYGSDSESVGEALGNAAKGAVIGGVAGAASQAALRPLFRKAEKAFEMSDKFRYGYLADHLARGRDTLRFTLSPFFDISRYTEGLMLGQTGAPLRNAAGERVVMPLNMSPRKLIKELGGGREGEARFRRVVDEFNAAARGEFDLDITDNMSNWFQQVGIMGFNPQTWMATAFHRLKGQGFDGKAAYEAVRDTYTYGVRGRSAAEQSINFIFFPFSFQKKAYGHLAKFIADDLSRSVVLHDALKTYEVLNERYDLNRFWEEHIPVLDQLQKLNMFAFGISPGRLGGINRPYIEPAISAVVNSHGKSDALPGILNLFNPQGLSLGSAAEAADLQKVVQKLMPVYNDINWMIRDVQDQGHVLFSDSHQSKYADVRDGWQAWRDFRADFQKDLDRAGYKMTDLSKPWMAQAKLAYETKRAEIGEAYPGWKESRKKVAEEYASLGIEKQDRLDAAKAGTGTVTDLMMWQYEQMLAGVKEDMKLVGIDDLADLPEEALTMLLNTAAEYGKANAQWRSVWKKFYEPQLGGIEAPLNV